MKKSTKKVAKKATAKRNGKPILGLQTVKQVIPTKFKMKVLSLIDKGMTGKAALEKAAQQFGVTLTPSMIQYPSSIIHSYRNQEL